MQNAKSLSGANKTNSIRTTLTEDVVAARVEMDIPRAGRIAGIGRRRPIETSYYVREVACINRFVKAGEAVVHNREQFLSCRQPPVGKAADPRCAGEGIDIRYIFLRIATRTTGADATADCACIAAIGGGIGIVP